MFHSVGNTVFVFHGLAESGQSAFGNQRRDFGPTEETRRLQGASAVRRRPIGRSADRPGLPDTARLVGRVATDVQSVGHRLHAVRRPQEKRELTLYFRSTRLHTLITRWPD